MTKFSPFRQLLIKAIAIISVLLASSFAYGDNIYKWTDEHGQVHYDSSPPASIKRSAKTVDTSTSKVADDQRQEAIARFAREKQLANQTSNPVKAQPAVSASSSVSQSSQDSAPPTDKKSQCEEEWRKYRESLDCVAPYRTALGGMKEEVTQHCTILNQPAEMCGF